MSTIPFPPLMVKSLLAQIPLDLTHLLLIKVQLVKIASALSKEIPPPYVAVLSENVEPIILPVTLYQRIAPP